MASENDADYRVKLTEAYLKIRKVKVSPSISIAHTAKKGPAIYPVRRVEAKVLSFHNVFNGLVPKTFVFGMVDSAAFYGATIKILTTLKPIPHPSSRLLSMEKYPSNPYSFPIRQQIPDISKLTLPYSPVLKSYFTMPATTFRVMILRMVMPCMLLT